MRRMICLVLYTAMLLGGTAIIYVQMMLSRIIYFKFVGGAAILIFLAIYLFWEDFLKPDRP